VFHAGAEPGSVPPANVPTSGVLGPAVVVNLSHWAYVELGVTPRVQAKLVPSGTTKSASAGAADPSNAIKNAGRVRVEAERATDEVENAERVTSDLLG
jgi:hypothetical protein